MSDLSVSVHNFEDLCAGKIDFNAFKDGELALFRKEVDNLPATIQPVVEQMTQSFAAGASALVGLGQTSLGTLLNGSTDAQATLVLNLLQSAGIPTGGVALTDLELAGLSMLINGLKTGLDRVALKVATAGPKPEQEQEQEEQPQEEQPTPALQQIGLVPPLPTPQPDPAN